MEIQTKTFNCQCGKKYKHAPSLCVHRKECSVYQEHKITNPNPIKLSVQEKDDVSVLSSTSDSSLARILELENELKITELKNKYELRLKDMEMENILKMKTLELENCKLTFQLHAKDLENILLTKILNSQPVVQVPQPAPVIIYQPAPVPQPAPVQVVPQAPVQVQSPVIQKIKKHKISLIPVEAESEKNTQKFCEEDEEQEGDIPTLKQSKLAPVDYLNKYYIEAIKLEECNKLLEDDSYNKYIENVYLNNQEETILKREFIKSKSDNFTVNPIENSLSIAKSFFSKLELNELPFYFNKSKKELYIKINDEWLLDNVSNSDKINAVLFSFITKSLQSVQWASNKTRNIFKNNEKAFMDRYELNYAKWVEEHTSEFTLYLSTAFETTDLKETNIKKMKLLMKNWK